MNWYIAVTRQIEIPDHECAALPRLGRIEQTATKDLPRDLLSLRPRPGQGQIFRAQEVRRLKDVPNKLGNLGHGFQRCGRFGGSACGSKAHHEMSPVLHCTASAVDGASERNCIGRAGSRESAEAECVALQSGNDGIMPKWRD